MIGVESRNAAALNQKSKNSANVSQNNSQQKLKGAKKGGLEVSLSKTLGASSSTQQLKRKADKLNEIVDKE